MNYYQFHIGDYASHTRNLSIIEDIAYRRLLDEYYLHEKPLLCGVDAVARQIGMREYAIEVQYVLECFFKLTEDGWTNDRADAEIAKYREFAIAGKRGAEKRWGKGGDSPPNQGPMLTNNHKPITNKKNIYATPDGVSDSVWQDYVILRKSKKAAITQTAINGLKREAQKAHLSLEAALRICCERGWVGFKADWINGHNGIRPADKNLAAARTIFGDERMLSNEPNIIDI
jgi:uncharacterized protein YdaU (DUF1376 family)